MATRALTFLLTGRDEGASAAFLRVAGAADKTATSSRRAESGVLGFSKKAVAGLTALVSVDVAAHAVKSAAAFQKQMTMVRTQAGATQKEVSSQAKAILSVAASVGTAPTELAKGLYHFESIGLHGKDAFNALTVAAKGAKIGGADFEQTVNALTSTLASGIVKTKNYSAVMNDLLTIVGSGDMSLEQLNEALGTGVLAKVAGYGVTIKDVGAALASFGDQNIRGADAATSLRMVVESFAKPAAGGIAALNKIGLSAVSLRKDMQSGGLNKAVLDLDAHLKASGVTGKQVGGVLLDIFSKKGSQGVNLIVQAMERFETKYHDLNHAQMTFQQRWDAVKKTSSFAFDSMRAGLDSVGIQIGNVLLPGVTGLINFFTRDVGPALSGPFHIVVGAAKIAGAVLGDVFSLLGKFSTPLTAIGVGALGAYAGFKVFSGIGTLISNIPALLTRIEVALVGALDDALIWGRQMQASATGIIASNTAVAESSEATSLSIIASGEAAEVGWAGLLGPIGAVAVGVGALVMMFHKSNSASKEATDAAKAYADVFQGGNTRADLLGAITKQLSDNDVPAKLKELNAGLIGTAKVTGKQFVAAISGTGKPLDAMRTRLQAIIKDNRMFGSNGAGQQQVIGYTKTGQAAQKVLKDLNVQYDALGQAAKKDLLNTKTFAGAAGAIQKTTTATQLGTQAAQDYATMAGLVVSKNGIVAESQGKVNAAVARVASAYNTASAAGSEFLGALKTFSSSTGTASDRASLIGSILKANAGDALTFQTAVNSAVGAVKTLGSDAASNAKQVGKGGVSVRAYTQSLVDMTSGSIKYHSAAAAPLLSDLANVQSSALAAAQAQYQHSRALLGGKGAADAALASYKGVKDSLRAQLVQMGLSTGAAQKLTNKYLGVPSRVRTLIEAAGTDPVINVLNKIGTQLSLLTGHSWAPTLGIIDQASGPLAAIMNEINAIPSSKTITIYNKQAATPGTQANTDAKNKYKNFHPSATGNIWRAYAQGGVEQHTAQIASTRPGTVRVWAEPETRGEAYIPLANDSRRPRARAIASETVRLLGGVAMFAKGGVTHSGKDWIYGGVHYASQRAAENAQRRAGKTASADRQSSLGSMVSSAISGVGQPYSPPFAVADVGINRVQATIASATKALLRAISEGLSRKTADRYRDQIKRLQGIANKELGALRVKIKTSDIRAIRAGLKTSVDDTRTALQQMYTDLARSGASAHTMAGARANGSALIATQNRLTAGQAQLATMKDYRSGIQSTLLGGFDSGQYGSIADLRAGIQGATGTNKAYSADLAKLYKRAGKSKAALALINDLAAKGQTATLQTLASASAKDDAAVFADYGKYRASVNKGSDVATTAEFSKSVAQMVKENAATAKREAALVTAIGKLAAAVGEHTAKSSEHTKKHVDQAVNDIHHALAAGGHS